MLAKVVAANQRDWCEHLPSVIMAYRASVHETTKYSPNRLMFGHENRLPVDLVLGDVQEQREVIPTDDFVADLTERQRADFELVREQLRETAQRRKEAYDDNVKSKTFVEGQKVWYFYPRRRQGLSPKWQKFYDGPYTVVRLIDSHTVVIRRSKRAKCIVVHRENLRRAFRRSCLRKKRRIQ